MATIQVVEPDIYERLADFLSQSGNPSEPVELIHQWFRLWWEENPAFAPGMKRGWVVIDSDRIGGFIGSLPCPLQLGGKPVTAFSATTWRVLPEFRNQTMGLIFQWMALGKTAPLFGTTPTNDVVKILQTLRFTLLPPADNHNASVLVLNSRNVLASMAGDSGMMEFAALLAGPAANQVQRFLARKVHGADLSKVRRICQADSSFDDLWERTRHIYANTNVRTAAWVNWYSFQPPNAGKLLLGYQDGAGLHAYILCQPKKHDRLKVLECADFWTEPDCEEALPALLRATEDHARAEGYDLVLLPHFTAAYGTALSDLGLLTREIKLKTNYFKPTAGADVKPENSYFVSAQGDYGLG